MASSISITSSSTFEGRIMTLSCTQTQNITDNTSTINWTLTTSGGEVNWYATGPTTVLINGTQVYYAPRSKLENVFPTSKGSVSGKLTVPHNTDGSKSIAVSLTTAIYYGSSKVKTNSETWELDRIPRYATLLGAPNFNHNSIPQIYYSNPLGEDIESLKVCIAKDEAGSNILVGWQDVTKTDIYYLLDISAAERRALGEAVVGSTSTPIYFILSSTLNGVTEKSALQRAYSVIGELPTLSYAVWDDNSNTAALTGDSSKFIKYFSVLGYTFTPSGKHYAQITSKSVTYQGVTKDTSIGTFSTVESNSVVFSATDNRGQTSSQPVTLDMIDYVKLSCNLTAKINAKGVATLDVSGNYFNDTFGDVHNSLALQYRYKAAEGEWSNWVNFGTGINDNTYSNTINVSGLDYQTTYVFQARAIDELMTVPSEERVITAVPVFDWGSKDFNFNVPVVTVQGVPVPTIVEQAQEDIWTYRKWSDGTSECWGTKNVLVSFPSSANWGALYTTGNIPTSNIDFPIGLFIETPSVSANLLVTSYGGFLMAPGNSSGATTNSTQTGAFEIARGTYISGSPVYTINYQVKGRWK